MRQQAAAEGLRGSCGEILRRDLGAISARSRRDLGAISARLGGGYDAILRSSGAEPVKRGVPTARHPTFSVRASFEMYNYVTLCIGGAHVHVEQYV